MSLKNLIKDPDKISPQAAAASVREATLWTIVLALLIFKLVLDFIGAPLDFEDPVYLVQQSVRVGLAGFPVAILRVVTILAIGFGAIQWLENSAFGQRVVNKGILFSAVLIATALAFGGGR